MREGDIMRVLILDDDSMRQEAFLQNNPGHEITTSVSARESIRLSKESRFDVVLLDQDLDDFNEPNQPSNGTGLEVAVHLTKLPMHHQPRFVVVHSTNALTAGEMMQLLTEAGLPCAHLPRCWDKKDLIDRIDHLSQ
jgi:CheY-like chemotaxis protein